MRRPAAEFWRFALAAHVFVALMMLLAWALLPWRVEHPAIASIVVFATMTFSGVAAAPSAARANWKRALLYGFAAYLALHGCALLAAYAIAALAPSMWASSATTTQLAILALASPLFLFALWPIWRWVAP